MNRLLKRQIKRHLGGEENIPENLIAFIEAIDRSYSHYEDDRLLLERSMEISSGELEATNEQIREESEKQGQILNRLKESLNTLLAMDGETGEETSFINDEDDILKVIDFIEIQSRHIKSVEEEILQVQHFINQSNDAIQVMDADGKLVFANDNALKWIRTKRSNAYGKPIFGLDSKFEDKVEWKDILSNLVDETPRISEKIQYRQDGSFPVEMSMKRVRLQDDDFVISVARDITSRKEAERMQGELIESLTKANEELENFAYIVSHDLKAPIRGIGSAADWLMDDYEEVLDDEGKNLVNLIKRRVLRMQQLIEGILQYSRIGRKDKDDINIDLNELLGEVVDNVSEGLSNSTFELMVPESLPSLSFNEIRLQQIFQNLISNAIKYGDKDKCKVTITFKEDRGFYEFCVEDNGPGIAPSYHEKIFKIFQTLQARDQFESTGIGLSIIKKIIEQAGGQIWLDSDVGKGCRFYFTLMR